MRIWAQLLLVAAVGTAGVVGMAHQLPAARPMLERAGIWDLLDRAGLAPAQAAAPHGAVPAAGPGRGPAAGPGQGPGGGAPVSITAAAPQLVPLVSQVAAIGTGASRRSVAVRPEVGGRLAEVLVASGARVAAGEVLARLEAASEEIARTRAQLLLQDAQAGHERVARLHASGSATDLQLSTAELALRQAELALQQAEFELARRTILAPIDGLAGIVEVGPGDQVGTGDPITRIDDRAVILVDFTVPERFVGRVALGAAVAAQPLARPELALEGRIHAIENRVDPATRTIRMQAAIDNAGDVLRAGMAFAIRMTFEGESYPAVDPLAIQWSSAGSYVWVAREGRAARVPVQIVQRSAAQVLVRADFQPGDLVVIEGVQSLRLGSPVQVEGPPPGPRAPAGTDAGAAVSTPPQQG